ncbi:MAG TPA: PrgI family protein [Candidatus Vogelbacteria bacterium]|nr:PrgI family protein [Candidatus Vogelbacteria bacterium]
MQFQVPQFIEIEDKIFGPLTFKQFIYLVGGGGMSFLIYVFLPLYLAIIPIILIAGFALALAFWKINDRPFIAVLESGFYYLFTSRKYIWKKEKPKSPKDIAQVIEKGERVDILPRLSKSNLEDLSWKLDIKKEIE